jgi:adenylate cyclase
VTAAAPAVAGVAQPADRSALLRGITGRFGCSMVVANMAGGAIVFLLLGFELPRAQRYDTLNVIALFAYAAFSVIVGCIWSTYAFRPIRDWAVDGRPVSSDDRVYVVRHPLRQALINFALWIGAILFFVPINAKFGFHDAFNVGETIFLGGITTCGLTYLLAERILRPINQLAFEDGLPTDKYVPGVKSRILLAWTIGTGIPLLGVVMIATDPHQSPSEATRSLAFLGTVGIVTGIFAIVFAAKSVADPVESVTSALRSVEEGNLAVQVPVYDGSQVGQLQNGFNAMAEGLRERHRLHDLFGRQVGVDVVSQALEQGVRLGGKQVDAAVLFVDVIGSTELAATRRPDDVVAALNDFFAIVVDVTDRTGGFVNKFEGDGALCVFGAPVERDDAATCALLAARLLHDRLDNVRGLSAAIGVSAGTVVAGNIGARERFEYTVIGDSVNEAARLTELAKARPGRLLVSATALERADESERVHWTIDGEVVLRGRTTPTSLVALR